MQNCRSGALNWKKMQKDWAKWKGGRGWHTLVFELFWEKASNLTKTKFPQHNVGQRNRRVGKDQTQEGCNADKFRVSLFLHSSTQLNLSAEGRICGKYLSSSNFPSTVDSKLSDTQRTLAGGKDDMPVDRVFHWFSGM